MGRQGQRRLRIAGSVLLGLLALLSLAVTLTVGWRPILGPRARLLGARRFEATPERVERGRYLADGVLHCFACHSQLDASAPGMPPLAGRKGAGRVLPDEGFGRIVAPNITPDPETGAGNWTDDMLARALREGIGHDGRALFPMMPYENLRQLSDEDLAAVVVYLRTLPPVRHELPPTAVRFPLNYLIKSVPEPIEEAVAAPDPEDRLARGAYLTRLGNCATCHTPAEQGEPVAGLEFAGGLRFKDASGRELTAPNITPDPSGISYYDEGLFLRVMRTGEVGARRLSPQMPWGYFRHMTDEDLRAVFAYLRTLKPIDHVVDNLEGPTPCRVCRARHGAGEHNHTPAGTDQQVAASSR